jgi:hypothetical protein
MDAARPCHGTGSLHYVVQLSCSIAVELSDFRKQSCGLVPVSRLVFTDGEVAIAASA